jgi:SAM-dependent methyltransferase
LASEDFEEYLEVNKKHWNVWARRDWPYKKKLLEQIRNGGPFIEEVEPRLVPYLKNIQGKKVFVPQFGDGLVMLACAKRGAIVTGVDSSSEQIRLAEKAMAYCGVDVNLLEADIQKLPTYVPSDYFDIAVTECGIFGWIGNLDALMSNVYKVLKNGGKLVVSDFHPLSVLQKKKRGKWPLREVILTKVQRLFDQKKMCLLQSSFCGSSVTSSTQQSVPGFESIT